MLLFHLKKRHLQEQQFLLAPFWRYLKWLLLIIPLILIAWGISRFFLNTPAEKIGFGALVPVLNIDTKKVGFEYENGGPHIRAHYDDAKPFSKGFATVKLYGNWGLINESDSMIIRPQYTSPLSFVNGLSTYLLISFSSSLCILRALLLLTQGTSIE